MKQRDIIYLKENEFCITGTAIWMSEWELAELFYATQGEIRAAINRMLKDGAILACHSTRYMPLENGHAAEVYSLEAIIVNSLLEYVIITSRGLFLGGHHCHFLLSTYGICGKVSQMDNTTDNKREQAGSLSHALHQ